ncbi:MAG: MBL fold metallo-hydrolase [Acidimicrobiia bacterium]|nr:MBL fold metallo-hydrolase [Acidimicrobiia bacterium]MDH4362991.1 MBL fold metallo-hydrolase [Acidimicrobiia bacterium]
MSDPAATNTEAKPQVREERQPAREGADEVAPGVLRIQLPISLPGLGHVNCYVMEDKRGIALVDPGLPGLGTWRQLKKRLATAGFNIDRVHTVIVTHSHPDHFGQARRFQRKVGAEIVTHQRFRTFLDPRDENDDWDSITVFEGSLAGAGDGGAEPADPGLLPARINGAMMGPLTKATPWGGKPFELPLARRMRWMAMKLASGQFVVTPQPTNRVEDADVLELGGREWVSVHTPGHTQDHLCLWDPANKVMISGDHVLPTITPHISGMGITADPLADFFRSLDRMQTFGDATVLPAHGLEFHDLHGRAEDIKAHHRERLEVLRKAGDTLGRGTVNQFMKALFQERAWGPMAESETYAHLEHLRILKQARVSTDGELLRYEIVD